jgi:MYXO-CTERM domain-containing protein
MQRNILAVGALSGAALFASSLTPTEAEAHFALVTPAAATMQDDLGSPQKTAPCGPNGAGTPTGAVTTYQAGETITVTIDERICHPGHYRVALAVNDPNELPAAPPVTPSQNDECASTVIQDPPTFPVIADGMFEHACPFTGEQSFDVTLPSDVTCDNCTLQVIQYMSNHNAPCFYYHCANIAIEEAPATTSATSTAASTGSGGAGGATSTAASGTGGGMGGDDGGGGSGNYQLGADDEGGCSCRAAGDQGGHPLRGLLAVLGVGVVLAQRRRHGRSSG